MESYKQPNYLCWVIKIDINSITLKEHKEPSNIHGKTHDINLLKISTKLLNLQLNAVFSMNHLKYSHTYIMNIFL